ncbi:AraC family transcriptional regulator [Firmicutes bacterium AM55-24TS]|nr:AraC family transcriptional regulator [Firmicutes bacterium AM55-24TS]RHP09774.1 AraC family transcriptional regulator [Firmicutes bacterium AF36-3BH]
MSKEHLCCIFRDISDTSPIVYLNRYRTTQSAYMLRNTNKSISEISSLCGFNNGSYFDKMFMRFMKCTPSEYRNKK